jgi:hypothetical protein
MNNALKYILVGVLFFALGFVAATPFWGVGASSITGCGWGQDGTAWGMGPGMMPGGWGFPGGMMTGFGMFGGLMMFGMFLYPVLIVGLIAAGIVWLVKAAQRPNQQP